MKTLIRFFLTAFFLLHSFAIEAYNETYFYENTFDNSLNSKESNPMNLNESEFSVAVSAINSKYSEIVSGMFRNKLIMISSKKIGGLGNGIDPNTNQPYTDIFCLDIKKNGKLSRPLLFSRILNTKDNEGHLTFTEDENTIYFTRSKRENSLNFQLFRATLQNGSYGNWENIEILDSSSSEYSIENPFIIGNKLYFASNMPGGFGGFDIYVADIKEDGTLDIPVNMGSQINTSFDEKYPFVSKDNKRFYFASQGHNSLGGFDIFTSRIVNNTFKSPRNLGSNVNSEFDEIAFFLSNENQGYLSSNKAGGFGSYDIYKFDKATVTQILTGKAIDKNSKIPLPNTLVILTDEEGLEIGRQYTDENAKYSFPVSPFESYTITSVKDGFIENQVGFEASRGVSYAYQINLELEPTKPLIVEVDDKFMISIENIYFDFNKWTIKEESTISLNMVADILNENPEMRIAIYAHTDYAGKKGYNQTLSEKRAFAAMNYLINSGIDSDRLISQGFGETQPVISCADNCTKEDNKINRRIEFEILKQNPD